MGAEEEIVTTAVCAEDELADGQVRVFEVEGQEGIVVRSGDTVYACQRFCAHQKFPLEFGQLRECNKICCTYHGAEYDLRTGEVKKEPAKGPIKVFSTRIEDGMVLVDIPRS